MNDTKVNWVWIVAGLVLLYFVYNIGYGLGAKSKFIKSDNATLIEGACVDILNRASDKRKEGV